MRNECEQTAAADAATFRSRLDKATTVAVCIADLVREDTSHLRWLYICRCKH